MKKLFFLAFALSFFSAKSQYFQHTYGFTADEHGVAGVNTTGPSPLGQLITGVTLSCLPFNTLPAAYTDLNGNIPGPPFFNENYLLAGPTGNALHVTGLPQAMEMATCPGILGLVGAYVDNFAGAPNNTGVFFMQVLPGGIPGPIFNYTTVAGSGFEIVDLTGLKKSPTVPGDWYLTGTARDPGGVLKAYAMRFNECTGAMVWSQIYDIPGMGNTWGRDIEENLINVFGFPGAAIVGQVVNGPSNDCYLIHIDATTGLPAPHPVILYGTPASNEEFRSIRQAPAGPLPPGFILGGYSNVAGNVDFLAIRMDPLIAPFFMNLIDYSFAPGTDNYCYDVIHRMNSLCQDEYYAVGNARVGQFGGADVMVVKMDQFGVGVAGGEFIYGGPGNDFGNKLDQRTMVPCGPPPPNFDGLTVFGSTNGSFPSPGGADMYMIKAYYNGVSGCNEAFNNPLIGFAFPPMPMGPVFTLSNLNANPNLQATHYRMKDITLCFNPMLAAGSNARTAPDESEQKDGVLIMPNPAEMASREVSLQLESEAGGPVTIEIFDMLGKQYYTSKHELTKGLNKLPVDLSETNMSTGMYTVKITGDNENRTVILIVK